MMSTTWKEACPWLWALDWANNEVQISDTDRLSEAVDYAIAKLSDVQIVNLLPTASTSRLIPLPQLSTRCCRILCELGIRRLSDFNGMQIRDLADHRSVGAKTLREALSVCLKTALDPKGGSDAVATSHPMADALNDISLSDSYLTGPDPASSVDLATEPLNPDGDPNNCPGLVDRPPFSGIPPRNIAFFRERKLSSPHRSLEEIGQDNGITRERVRQVVEATGNQISAEISASPELARLSVTLSEAIPVARPTAAVLAAHPELGRTVDVFDVTWLELLALVINVHLADGWAYRGTVSAHRQAAEAAFQSGHDSQLFVPTEALCHLIGEIPARLPTLENWLRFLGFTIIDGKCFATPRSIPGWARVYLTAENRPLTTAELVARLPEHRSERSTRNVLGTAPDIQRCDRDQWALKIWGLPEYTSIKDLIAHYLHESGGTLPLRTLQKLITDRFDVSEASVVAYSNAPPFANDRGIIRMADEIVVSKTPAQTTRMFQTDTGWRYRITLNPEHLRGSGSPLPIAFATAFGINFGEHRQFNTDFGPINVYYTGGQLALGSIRSMALASGWPVGTEVFVDFTESRSTLMSLPPLAGNHLDAYSYAGLDPRSANLADLAFALCRSDLTTWEELYDAANARGDRDIAAALIPLIGSESGTIVE